MAMVPHERSLVNRFKGQPFVLLGVSEDQTEAKARQTAADRGMNWRSWWDGAVDEDLAGLRYKVEGLPTIYLIDPKGVIRYQRAGSAGDLNREIKELLAEAEKTKP